MGGSSIANRALRVGDRAYAVIGVMPDGFEFPGRTAVWLAREIDPPDQSRTAHNYQALGRLRRGVPLAAAQAEIGALSRALKARYGDGTWMSDATAVPLLDQLTAAGFSRVRVYGEPAFKYGVYWPQPWSLPIAARA